MFLVQFGFFVFLAVTLAAYYLVPGKIQWMVLLLANVVFYCLAGRPWTIVYLIATIVSVWWGAVKVTQLRGVDKKLASRIVTGVIVLNFGILGALKYTNFFLSNARRIGGIFGVWQNITTVRWAAALGVSFYTLQALSYFLDVYWERCEAEPNLGKVALFVSWFPQMSSGPISRYEQIGTQLIEPHKFDYRRLCFGLQRMLIGLIKKLVLAENLGIYVGYLFDGETWYTGWFIWIGMIAYLIQLYADFSGCMDIVLGAAECFGIYMPENFNRPFHSQSIQEFWKRWHITLGAWAQDYIMFPLLHSKAWSKMRKSLKKKFGKKAAKNVPTYIGMLVLWLFMGLWHGGEWRYVLEMIWFWLVIMGGQLLEPQLAKLAGKVHATAESRGWQAFRAARTSLIFGMGVTLFRANSVKQGLKRVFAAFWLPNLKPSVFKQQLLIFKELVTGKQIKMSAVEILAGMLIFGVMIIFAAKGKSFREWLEKCPLPIRWIILYGMLFTVILFGVYGPGFNASDFIYGGF